MKKFKNFLKILPQVVAVVNFVEASSSGKVKIGASKAAMALDILKTGSEVAYGIEAQDWLNVVPAINNTIDAYVKFANSVGIFKKSD